MVSFFLEPEGDELKKKRILTAVLAVIIVLCTLGVIRIVWANTAVILTEYTVKSENLPESFEGFKIAHISDLHNGELGEDNEKVISLLEKSNPDIIAVTGDLIDSYKTDTDIALSFMKRALQIAPCYYVNGNHEERVMESYEEMREELVKIGVTVLENKSLTLEREGEGISILGVSDPGFETDYLYGDTKGVVSRHLDELLKDSEEFTLLLSHRPELFELYIEKNIDLALTGHAHGGQFRLPFVGGLYAPNQGIFPEYDSGIYTEDGTNMVVSRGLGNSLFPLRFNNRPEVIVVTLCNS